MESGFGERFMMTCMVIGFLLSAGYALSSSHRHKGEDAPAPATTTQSSNAN